MERRYKYPCIIAFTLTSVCTHLNIKLSFLNSIYTLKTTRKLRWNISFIFVKFVLLNKLKISQLSIFINAY